MKRIESPDKDWGEKWKLSLEKDRLLTNGVQEVVKLPRKKKMNLNLYFIS